MLPTFEDFIKYYPKYQGLINNADARRIYDFLSAPDSLASMIQANNQNKPALSGCIRELEANYSSLPDFSLTGIYKDTVKQAVGSMVRVLLEPFGYTPLEQKRIPTTLSTLFTSATIYKFDPNSASLKLVYRVERV